MKWYAAVLVGGQLPEGPRAVDADGDTFSYRPGVAFDLYVQLWDYFKNLATSQLTGSGVVVQLQPDAQRQPGLKAAGVSDTGSQQSLRSQIIFVRFAGVAKVKRVYVGGSAQPAWNQYNWTVDSTWFRLGTDGEDP